MFHFTVRTMPFRYAKFLAKITILVRVCADEVIKESNKGFFLFYIPEVLDFGYCTIPTVQNIIPRASLSSLPFSLFYHSFLVSSRFFFILIKSRLEIPSRSNSVQPLRRFAYISSTIRTLWKKSALDGSLAKWLNTRLFNRNDCPCYRVK